MTLLNRCFFLEYGLSGRWAMTSLSSGGSAITAHHAQHWETVHSISALKLLVATNSRKIFEYKMARELAHPDTNKHKVWEIRTKERTDYKEKSSHMEWLGYEEEKK